MGASVRPKRGGGGATGGGGAASTATSAGSSGKLLLRSSSSAASAKENLPSSLSATAMSNKDPSQLLARGYTARFLSPLAGGIKALNQEEIDRDLRHFEAYRSAVISYRQQYYVAVNQKRDGGIRGLPGAAVPGSSSLSSGAAATADVGAGGRGGDVGGKAGAVAAVASSSAITPGGASSGGAAPISLASLPVRIDVEEEKRLATLRKKIFIAEHHRENAEQQYVALRAHYVQVSRALAARVKAKKEDAASAESTDELLFLKDCVGRRATAVGLLRARLQMTRDVLNALRHRTRILEDPSTAAAAASSSGGAGGSQPETSDPAAEATAAAARGDDGASDAATSTSVGATATSAAAGGDGTGATATNTTAQPAGTAQTNSTTSIPGKGTGENSNSSADVLGDIWTKVVEDSINNIKSSTSGGGKKNKKMPFACTRLPPTPHDVPLLVSALSQAPEKTLAFGVSGGDIRGKNKTPLFFGAKPSSLVWLESEKRHLPPDGEYGDPRRHYRSAADDDTDASEIANLSEEVFFLQSELEKERTQNEEWSRKITEMRIKNDELVAMICLLRQETEAVLYRHNIILESDIATESAERLNELQRKQMRQNLEKQQKGVADAKAAASAAAGASNAPGTEVAEAGGEKMAAEQPEKGSALEGNGKPVKGEAVQAKEATKQIDDANDGDDEGSGSNEDDDTEQVPAGNWSEDAKGGAETTSDTAGAKRSLEEDGEVVESENDNKRRKV